MKTRDLGRSGLTVSALGLGCMGMGVKYGTPRDRAKAADSIPIQGGRGTGHEASR